MIICFMNFSRKEDHVHIVSSRNSVHYTSFASKFVWNRLYIYYLYNLFGIIYSEKHFHFYTWTSHWASCLLISKTINTGENAPWVPIKFSCSLTYCFPFFSVVATKSLLAFPYTNDSVAPIPCYSFPFCSICLILLGDIMEIMKRLITTNVANVYLLTLILIQSYHTYADNSQLSCPFLFVTSNLNLFLHPFAWTDQDD